VDRVKPEEIERKMNACSPYVQDLLAQFANSANAAGQLNSQVNKEFAGTTAQIVALQRPASLQLLPLPTRSSSRSATTLSGTRRR